MMMDKIDGQREESEKAARETEKKKNSRPGKDQNDEELAPRLRDSHRTRFRAIFFCVLRLLR